MVFWVKLVHIRATVECSNLSMLVQVHCPLFDDNLILRKSLSGQFLDHMVHFCGNNLTYLHFMAPFYGWGSTNSRLVPLGGGSLLFTTKFPETSGTQMEIADLWPQSFSL